MSKPCDLSPTNADLPFQSEFLQFDPSWQRVLADELAKPYMADLARFLEKERVGPAPIYPPKECVFNAFCLTPFDRVKVVIVGQDPYHGKGQAHGLCFSVSKGVPPPPSLKNIFKELQADVGITIPSHGSLEEWARQGILLLNATLTVKDGIPGSHHGIGWELFTDVVIKKLCQRKKPPIFVLWGESAKKKCCHVTESMHANSPLLVAAHPSPFSCHRGFFGCRHFSKINHLLIQQGDPPIDWSLD